MVNIKISETTASKNQIIGAIPTGTIIPTILSVVPAGWLECDGSEVAIGSSGSTYYALSQQLGSTYGAFTNGSGGAGSTHFRLPNLKSSYLIPRVSTDNINVSSGGSNIHQHLVGANATSSTNGNSHNHNISQNSTGGDSFDHSHSGSAGQASFTGSNPGQVNKTGTGGSGQGSGAAHIHTTNSAAGWGQVTGTASNHGITSLGISSSNVDNHAHAATISGNSTNSESFPQSYVVRYLIKV